MAVYFLKGVRLFDGFELHGNRKDILVSDGVIQEITDENKSIAIPEDAQVVNGDGCTLLPGLIDAHTHVFRGEQELKEAINFGVTTVLDMHNLPENALYMKEQAQKTTELPQIFSALFAATIDGGWPRAIVRHTSSDPLVLKSLESWPKLSSVQDAREYVAHNKSIGADFIKLMQESGECLTLSDLPAPSKELQEGIVEAAHTHDLLTFAHATNLRETLLVLEAGVDGMAHQFFDQPHNDRLLDAYGKNNACLIPTLTAISSMMGLPTAKNWADRHQVPDPSYSTLCDCMKISKPGCSVQYAYDCIKALKDRGIDIICGTDSGPSIHGTALGSAVHLELSLYVEYCSFTPAEALRSATGLSACRLKLHDRGHVYVGKRADLLLVRGNPAERIDDTMNIERVWKAGRLCQLEK